MDNLEYLNQISKSSRPIRRPIKPGGASTWLIIKIAIVGTVLFFLLMALGAMLGNLGGKSNNLTKQLYSRTVSLNSTLSTYTPVLKSSRLRAIGSSLSSVLLTTSQQLATYIAGEDNDRKKLVLDDDTSLSEAELIGTLEHTLNNAKLNGILDRIYDNQIGLQVSLLLSLTSDILARTKDADLIAILEPFYSSLNTIHENIETYSDYAN